MASQDKPELAYGLLQIASSNEVGMVAQTSAYIHKKGGNIITFHAVRFGKQLFAATALISAPADKFAEIEQRLSAIKAYQPRLVRTQGLSTEARAGSLMYEFSAYAYDREGLVAEVAQVVAADGLDIVQLSCVTYPAPFDGQPLFMIEMILEASTPAAAKRVRANLEALALHRSWDVYWKPILATDVKTSPIAVFPPSKLLEDKVPKNDQSARE